MKFGVWGVKAGTSLNTAQTNGFKLLLRPVGLLRKLVGTSHWDPIPAEAQFTKPPGNSNELYIFALPQERNHASL